MALTAGTKLGPYEVQSPLGAGGMGEVYRARDTRLDRSVAIKILPDHLSNNPEAKQRFDREARAISSLNHANICTLFDVGHQEGIDFLVMEFLEGETLAARLARGPLPPEQLLKYAVEICEGLERAHRQGVVHRDLKPANIMLTKAGAKLMDFGLAKSAPTAQPPSSSLTMTFSGQSPSQPLTQRGTIIGTFRYMAPEQVEGHEADARSDIFALGAVLYEMATGKAAFNGSTQASIVAAILASEPPPISTLQPLSPPGLDRVVKVCLAKDPDERFQSAHDVKLQLKWIAEGGSQAGVPAPVAAQRKNRERTLIIAVGICALLALGGIAGSILYSRKAESLHKVVRAQISPPEHYKIIDANNSQVIVSPDGSTVAFVADGEGKRFLFVRPLNSATAQPMAGTEGAYYPFWSGDSKFIGFFAEGKLKKIDASGGVVQSLADAPFGRGGAWNREGVILFTPAIHDVIYRISDGGGQPVPITKFKDPGPLAGSRWPFFLPDGKHFLYTETDPTKAKGKVYAASLDSPDTKLILDEGTNAEYANGYLFFMKDKNLVAQHFDPKRLELSGNPIPIASKIEFFDYKMLGNYSVSQNGVLIYRNSDTPISRVTWFDRSGKQLDTLGDPGFFSSPRLSPDGRTIVVTRQTDDINKGDLWLMDAQKGTLSRATFQNQAGNTSAWSPDGSRIAVANFLGNLHVMPANASAPPTEISKQPVSRIDDWSPDGHTIIVSFQNTKTGWDVYSLPVDGQAHDLVPLLNSPFDEMSPRLSPDGHWLAYTSNESGRVEVYVVSFPGGVGRRQISNNGALAVGGVVWSHDGKQLYFADASGAVMAADVQLSGGDFRAELPRQIIPAQTDARPWAAAPDGKILALVYTDQGAAPIMMVLNWDAEMKN